MSCWRFALRTSGSASLPVEGAMGELLRDLGVGDGGGFRRGRAYCEIVMFVSVFCNLK